MHELEVLPVLKDPTRLKYRETHTNIISPPFRIAMVGASKSGKSNLLMNYLRPCYYGGDSKGKKESCFDRIYVFSPNLGMDSTTKAIKELTNESDRFMTYDDRIIDNIINYQKNLPEEGREKILIIADDLIALGALPQAKIFSSATYLRHLDCSILYLTQTYKGHYSLPPLVRNNLDAIIMFKNPSSQQIKSFCEDLQGTFGSKDNIKNLLEYSTREPYNFCFFDYRDLRVFHNHTKELWKKFNEHGGYNSDFKIPGGGNDSDDYSEEED